MNQLSAQAGLFIGIDWADQKHDIYIIVTVRRARSISSAIAI